MPSDAVRDVDHTGLTQAALDALPFGVIIVDREGTVIAYNRPERKLSGIGEKPVVGRNFFTEIAPCTAVGTFAGRLATFLDDPHDADGPFEFVFPFASAPQRVVITFLKSRGNARRATICVSRSWSTA